MKLERSADRAFPYLKRPASEIVIAGPRIRSGFGLRDEIRYAPALERLKCWWTSGGCDARGENDQEPDYRQRNPRHLLVLQELRMQEASAQQIEDVVAYLMTLKEE